MAWFDEKANEDFFAGPAAVKPDTDKDDWVDAAVAQIKPPMMKKAAMQMDCRAYFVEFTGQKTTDDFCQWVKKREQAKAQVALQPKPVVVAKPTVLKETPPPAIALKDLPVFSASAVKAEIAVGHEGLAKKRIKLRYHLLPNENATKAELEKAATKRTLKWVRRVFASANLSPKILGIDEITNIADNTLSVVGVKVPGYAKPKLPSGKNKTAGDSKITLVLTDSGSVAETIEIPLTADESTEDIAKDIARVLGAKGYVVVGPTTHLSDAAHLTSHDLVITKGGQPVQIKASHDDAQLGDAPGGAFDVLEVPTLGKGMDNEDGLYGGSPIQRKILRLGASGDDQIDIYVLPKGGLNGRAYPVYDEVKGAKSPAAPYRNAAYLTHWSTGDAKGVVFDDQLEVSPFTLPHEIGHVLGDTGHTGADGELMNGGWSKDNGLLANKRVYGKPLLVGSLDFGTEQPRADQDMSAELRSRGNKKVLDPW